MALFLLSHEILHYHPYKQLELCSRTVWIVGVLCLCPMWRFVSAGATPAGPGEKTPPLLYTLNNNVGRQTWIYDASAGTPEEREKVEQLRAAFTASRHTQRHSADELLRLQSASQVARKARAPPSTPLPPAGSPLPAERVEAHLAGAISFYECLQQVCPRAGDGRAAPALCESVRFLAIAVLELAQGTSWARDACHLISHDRAVTCHERSSCKAQ
jgi:hypothetical protein